MFSGGNYIRIIGFCCVTTDKALLRQENRCGAWHMAGARGCVLNEGVMSVLITATPALEVNDI